MVVPKLLEAYKWTEFIVDLLDRQTIIRTGSATLPLKRYFLRARRTAAHS
jgi:hypothetical protein